MMHATTHDSASELSAGLATKGLRPTVQRSAVYEVLVAATDHPSAEEVFSRTRRALRTISLATVYNCLETLVDCGLVRAVYRDRQPTRYCANHAEHAHLHDLTHGDVMDVPLPPEAVRYILSLAPDGFAVTSFDLNFRGSRHS